MDAKTRTRQRTRHRQARVSAGAVLVWTVVVILAGLSLLIY